MGTNFYAYIPGGRLHGRPHYYPLHIGKSSAGWVFSLHVYGDSEEGQLDDYCLGQPEPPPWLAADPPRSLERWREIFQRAEVVIVDEYGTEWAPERLLSNITERSHPCGLLRHAAGPHRHVRAGDGTFDLCSGRFW